MLRRFGTLTLSLLVLGGGCATRTEVRPAPRAGVSAGSHRESLPSLDVALGALAASRYGEAEKALSAIVRAAPDDTLARLALARLRIATGRYGAAAADAHQAASGQNGAHTADARLVEAEALWRQGYDEQARALLGPLAREYPEAQILLAEVLLDRGKRAEAVPVLNRLIEAYNGGRITESDGVGLSLVGRAAHLLRSPEDANEAYLEAERVVPNDVRLLLWRAELFLDAHDPDQAAEVIDKALGLAPNQPDILALYAHIKLDQALDFDHAQQLVERALAGNPHLARAHFVKAGLALRDGELATAEAILASGLLHNPENLELLSMQAAARFLADDLDGFAELERRVLARSPGFSGFYRIVGTYADWEHRYTELVDLMSRAVAADPDDAKARAILGFNLIRAGRERDGLSALTRAFDADPFDVRTVNTLNLYEKVIAHEYESVEDARFRIRYHREERPLLERYVPELLGRAWVTLRDTHGFEPRAPIGVELYSERRSFAIRTSGLPHTAIQGVCFGETLAALTPRHESFNFGMTLWHELAHVFHIGLSRSRVPRWFTEGLAEYETSLARPEWRREHDPALYQALQGGRIPEVALMNRAFTHAQRVEEIGLAYYASSRLVESLARLHGRGSFTAMLRGWGEGKATEEVARSVLGRGSAELDREFREFLQSELGHYQRQLLPPDVTTSVADAKAAVERAPTDEDAALDLVAAELDAGRFADAKRDFERAQKIANKRQSPRFLWLAAQLAALEQRLPAAADALQQLLALGKDGFDVRMLLAQLASRRGDVVSEARELERARAFDPSQSAPLVRLAMLAARAGDRTREIALLEELALLEQHDASVYRRLLTLLIEERRFDEAARWGESALWADIRGFETHSLWARALEGIGDSGRALFELESAVLCEASPSALAAAHRRAEVLCRRLGRARDAGKHRSLAAQLERSSG